MNIKNGFVRFGVFTAVGCLMGLGVSWASGEFGATCSIMCNPTIALTFGGLIGAVMSLDKPVEKQQ